MHSIILLEIHPIVMQIHGQISFSVFFKYYLSPRISQILLEKNRSTLPIKSLTTHRLKHFSRKLLHEPAMCTKTVELLKYKAAVQLPTDSSMEQLIQLLKRSPEIAEPLLQMSHILKDSK